MPPNEGLKARVTMKERRRWKNKHQTFTQPLERLYDVWNPQGSPSVAGLKATVAALQSIIGDAVDARKRLRALGSGWSFSTVAATEDWMLNTKPLNWVFPLGSSSVAGAYAGDRDDLLFAQCGVAILELNNYLVGKKKSLKTSGASNGQTIAGALSTGTHGSALDVGAIPNYVVGLHLIVGRNRHVWLERASYPVVTPAFAGKLGAELIRDDTLFNAALVSFGSFGIIHGVLLEVDDLFLLEAHRVRLPFDDALKRAITTLDFTGVPLPHGSERPYHFEVVANPYDLDGGLRATVMYRRPYRTDYTPPEIGGDGFHPGDDAAGFIGVLSDSFPQVVPVLVNGLIDQLYKPYSNKEGTLGEIFYNTSLRGKAAGAAMGVPRERALEALETAVAVHRKHGPFAAVVALRYLKGSSGLLAFTRFPETCVVDLDGVLSERTLRFYDHVWRAFEDAGIPFTMHWGKFNDYLTAERVRRMYGGAVDAWLQSRRTLLDSASRGLFTNVFLERCGLAG